MRNEDNNDCIRYLMKEMDPSEELLMERAMMEDEDLLIEVESMRQTFKKLDRLPEVKPPSHVQESVMKKAAEQAKKNRTKNRSLAPAFKYAVAATLALTITAGGTWLYTGVGAEEQRAAKQAGINTTSPARSTSQPANSASTQSVNTANTAPSSTQLAGTNTNNRLSTSGSSRTTDIQPWIDRDNVLHFEDLFSGQQQKFQTILEQATEKLQRIESPSINDNRVNSIQLTGSGN